MKLWIRPFDLPDTPIDGHRVTYFRVAIDPIPRVVKVEAVYHVNRKYADLFPNLDSASRRVLDARYVDQWQIIEDGTSVGCTLHGWNTPWERTGWVRTFTTQADAFRHALAFCDERAEQLRAEAEEWLRIKERIR